MSPDRLVEREYKFPLQSQHFQKLEKAEQFPISEKRVKSAMSAIPGYIDQLMGFIVPDKIIQGQILNFLIRTINDTGGFDKLITFSDENSNPSKGNEAWAALRDHYYRASGSTIHELFTQFMKPQMEHETGFGLITRVINKRLEIKHNGVEIPLEQLKATLLGGLHEIYQSDIAYSYHRAIVNIWGRDKSSL